MRTETMTKNGIQRGKKEVLRYEKGELIIKQGDYGISIYKIVSGKVKVFRTYEGEEVPLATLESGNIIGEMAFLNKDKDVRSASARALEDSELEVWHPRDLVEKYAQTSVVLKIIIDQALSRLLRINRFMDQLAVKKRGGKRPPEGKEDPWSSTREFYRKKVDIVCQYKPALGVKGSSPPLTGRIKDISMGGLCLEVVPKNESATTHDVGDTFHIDTVLPNGQDLNVTAEIVSVTKRPGGVRFGMKFKELPDYYGTKKTLGFFLMPT
jgi:CRP-like cAMP-binding protein